MTAFSSPPAPAHAAPRRRRLRRAAAVLGAGAALGLLLVGLVGWAGAERAIHPPRQRAGSPPAGFPGADAVRFPSRDGVPLAGWFLPGRGRAAGSVVLLRGYGQSRADLLPHAGYLHRAGYNVLLLDFRGTGDSGGDLVTFGIKEPLDVLGAVDYLTGRPDVDASRIAVQGLSVGGAIGLLATARDPRLRAAVAESAFPDLDSMIDRNFRQYVGLPSFPFAPAIVLAMDRRVGGNASAVRPVEAVRALGDRAVFLIDDGADQLNPPDAGTRLYAAASGPKELWRIPGAGHAGGYFADPAAYAARVLAFYARYLAPNSG